MNQHSTYAADLEGDPALAVLGSFGAEDSDDDAPPSEVSRARRLWRSYTGAILSLALIVTAMFVFAEVAISRSERWAVAIDLAAGQPGVADEVLRRADDYVIAVNPAAEARAAGRMAAAVDAFDEAHRRLTAEETGLALIWPPELKSIYRGEPFRADDLSRDFVALAREILSRPRPDPDLVERLDALGRGPLDDALAAAAAGYTAAAEADVSTLRLFERLAWLAAVVILTLQATFVFRPASRVVNRALDVLEERRREEAERRRKLREREARLHEVNARLDSTVKELVSRADELERMNRTVAEERDASSGLVVDMSTEVRAPISGVVQMTRILLDTDLDVDQRDTAESILQTADSLLDYVNGVLDYNRARTGDLELAAEPFAAADLVEALVRTTRPAARRRSVMLEADLGDMAGARFVGDAARLRRLAANLVDVAVRTARRGVVRVSLDSDADGRLRVTVAEPAGAGDGTPDGAAAGAAPGHTDGPPPDDGAGMTLCRALAAAMGGEIGADSTADGGVARWVAAPIERLA